MLASCSKSIKFHREPEFNYVGIFEPPNRYFPIKSLSWCNQENQLLTVFHDGQIIVIDVSRKIRAIQKIDTADVQVATFFKTTKDILLGTNEGQVFLYDCTEKDIILEYDVAPSPVKFLEFEEKDSYFAAGCRNGQMFIYNASTAKRQICGSFGIPQNRSLSAMRFHPKERILAGGNNEGLVAVWEANTGYTKFVLKCHEGPVADLGFSFKNHIFATVGYDCKLKLYDLRLQKCVETFYVENSKLSALDFLSESICIAVGTTDGRLLSFDTRNISIPFHELKTHSGPVTKITFQIPQRKSMVTASSRVSSPGSSKALTDSEDLLSEASCSKDCHPAGDSSPLRKPTAMNIAKPVSQAGMDETIKKSLKAIELRNELLEFSHHAAKVYSEKLNSEILKFRMTVSKEVVRLEKEVNQRWQEFSPVLMRLAHQLPYQLESDAMDPDEMKESVSYSFLDFICKGKSRNIDGTALSNIWTITTPRLKQ